MFDWGKETTRLLSSAERNRGFPRNRDKFVIIAIISLLGLMHFSLVLARRVSNSSVYTCMHSEPIQSRMTHFVMSSFILITRVADFILTLLGELKSRSVAVRLRCKHMHTIFSFSCWCSLRHNSAVNFPFRVILHLTTNLEFQTRRNNRRLSKTFHACCESIFFDSLHNETRLIWTLQPFLWTVR